MLTSKWRFILASSSSIAGIGMVGRSFCDIARTPSPDPADCENPACHDTLEIFKLAKKRKKMKNMIKKSTNPYQEGCPATRGVLGDSTWKLIHTIAANFPETPREEDKVYTRMFFESLAMVYPCPHCAADFQESFAERPVEKSLSLWCCQLHNEVNEKLGMPLFPCTMEELDLRWKYGRESCFEGDTTSDTDWPDRDGAASS